MQTSAQSSGYKALHRTAPLMSSERARRGKREVDNTVEPRSRANGNERQI